MLLHGTFMPLLPGLTFAMEKFQWSNGVIYSNKAVVAKTKNDSKKGKLKVSISQSQFNKFVTSPSKFYLIYYKSLRSLISLAICIVPAV